MPYRRLPNTDQARARALKAAVEAGDKCDMNDLVISLNTLSEARNFLSRFQTAQRYYLQCYDNQAQAGRKHQYNVRMARLYISHFVQVLNLAIIRGEIREQDRELYGLIDSNVPDMSSDAALAEWGKKIIDGERQRTTYGGIPIYNPTIAKVVVHYELFVDSYEHQRALQSLTARSLDDLSAMRDRADQIILDIWNQVDEHFQDVTPDEERMELCKKFGLIYYYRTGEQLTLENF